TLTGTQVFLPFGSPEYIGLGFMVFATLVFVECFGSPFVRNCGVVISLMVGFIVAGIAGYTPPGSAEGAPQLRYVNADKINAAPWITFLWVETFPIHVYAPAILPVLIAFVVSTAETVGDIGATAESSRLATDSLRFDGRVQGGLLADGLGSLLAGLMMVPPNTTFSQNSGVIAITRCANKRAGYMCCFFLVLFGVIAKLAGILQSIPDCTLGGLTTFCFINVCVSGIRIFERATLGKSRNRFIVAASLALGLGALHPAPCTLHPAPCTLHPAPYTLHPAPYTPASSSPRIKILLSTPYSIGTILALFLNGILPED
ncbi:permease family-domain-containing protein, partial [Baffinella frigidus]